MSPRFVKHDIQQARVTRRVLMLGALGVSLAALPWPQIVSAASKSGPDQAGASVRQADFVTGDALNLLVERLTAADDAMQQLRVATRPEEAHGLARTILNQVTGPGGAYAAPEALAPGVFPSAIGAEIPDPGLALTIYDGTDLDAVRREFSETIIGEVEGWRQPDGHWGEIERVLAAWRPDLNTMPQLDGHLMRVVGWCVLSLRSDSAKECRGFASHGRLHTGLSLDAARRAQAAFQAGGA